MEDVNLMELILLVLVVGLLGLNILFFFIVIRITFSDYYYGEGIYPSPQDIVIFGTQNQTCTDTHRSETRLACRV